jgi:hypothetical protein
MILNNYWNLMAGMAGITPSFDRTANQQIGVRNMTNGNEIDVTVGWPTNFADVLPTMCQNWNPRANLSAVFGSGTTEPSATDYCLEDDWTASFSNVDVTVNTSADSASISTVVTISARNTSGRTITITEVGITKAIEMASSGTEPVLIDSLMVRHLLDTPKTVADNESFTLTLEWLES